ncbi:hypothetical protein SDC9_87198 [bioreactor metagenome]|uniref:Uncharacterized protein n=1 Tax=bioreactor metagenome TaxID=1076179 RepID=A0A644ZSI1_9ZZZZ
MRIGGAIVARRAHQQHERQGRGHRHGDACAEINPQRQAAQHADQHEPQRPARGARAPEGEHAQAIGAPKVDAPHVPVGHAIGIQQ